MMAFQYSEIFSHLRYHYWKLSHTFVVCHFILIVRKTRDVLHVDLLGVGIAVMLIFNPSITLIFGFSAGVSVNASLVLLLIIVLGSSWNVSFTWVVAGGLDCSCS